MVFDLSQYYFVISLAGLVVLTIGTLIGLWRGFIRATHRLIWIAVTTLLLFFAAPAVVNLFMDMDVSGFNIVMAGQKVTTVKEFTANMLATNFSLTPEQTKDVSAFIVSVISMILSGILFLPIYLLFNLIATVIYKILSVVFIHDKGKPKRHLLGALVGFVSSVIVLATVFAPVTGYISVYKSINEGFIKTGQEIENSDEIDKIISDYENIPIVKMFTTLGLNAYGKAYFNGVASTTINGKKVFLLTEAENLSEAIPFIVKYKDASEEGPEINPDELKGAFTAMMKSDLVRAGLKSALPLFKGAIEKFDFGDQPFSQTLKDITCESLDLVIGMDDQALNDGFDAIYGLFVSLADVSKPDFDIYSLDFSAVGSSVDNVINCGLITSERMNGLVCEILDSIVPTDEDENVKQLVDDIKAKMQSISPVYEKELKAVGTLLGAVKIVSAEKEDGSSDFAIEKDGATLGKIIDETIAIKAEIVNKQLIDGYIANIIDDSIDVSPEYATIKYNIKERLSLDYSYEKEFGYFQQLTLIAKHTIGIDTINQKNEEGKTLGERLDEVAPSLLVGDSALTLIDLGFEEYCDEYTQYGEILDKIKANYNDIKSNMRMCGRNGKYTYAELTAAFADLYDAVSDTTSMITGKDEFTKEYAELYETRLNELQSNILASQNGTRAIAAYVSEEVRQIILDKKETFAKVPAVANKLQELADYVECYKNYLRRNPDQSDKCFNEPYASDKNTFVSKTDFGAFSVRVNKPFSYLWEKLAEVIGA